MPRANCRILLRISEKKRQEIRYSSKLGCSNHSTKCTTINSHKCIWDALVSDFMGSFSNRLHSRLDHCKRIIMCVANHDKTVESQRTAKIIPSRGVTVNEDAAPAVRPATNEVQKTASPLPSLFRGPWKNILQLPKFQKKTPDRYSLMSRDTRKGGNTSWKT